jgi:hypothetical protein
MLWIWRQSPRANEFGQAPLCILEYLDERKECSCLREAFSQPYDQKSEESLWRESFGMVGLSQFMAKGTDLRSGFDVRLGKPKAVRKPRFKALEGFVFLMPKSLEKDITTAICLREKHMNRLNANVQFGGDTQYIG